MTLCECGCGRPAPIAKRTRRHLGWVKGQPKRFINGHSGGAVRHGACGTPEYRAYINAKVRCVNPNSHAWENYGGRGIRFLFGSFEAFLSCVGPRPVGLTIDRIDNDSHYMPGNMRWATRSEQRRNQRYTKWLPRGGEYEPR